jgi:fatty-acyl-CoA synthase
MAAIVTGPGFDLAELRARLAQALPSYARPLFIRLTPALTMTETLKKASHRFAAEGFDPARVRDPLFLDDLAEGNYAPMDAELFGRLNRGAVRL